MMLGNIYAFCEQYTISSKCTQPTASTAFMQDSVRIYSYITNEIEQDTDLNSLHCQTAQ